MTKAEELAMKCVDGWESENPLSTGEYNSLCDAVESALKNVAKMQRHAIAKELSKKSMRPDMASNILLEPHAHNIAMNTRVV